MRKLCFLLLPLLISANAAAEETMKVGEVVVTATKVEETIENVSQDVTVITSEEIRTASFGSIGDALKHVTGVLIRENGSRGAISSASVRGSNAQGVLILVDGKRMNKPSDGQVDLNIIPVPLDNIERIEVLRGASSALYGADAMGGVINIITKIPAEAETHASFRFGRFDTWSAAAGTSGTIGSLGYLFTAAGEESSGFRMNSDYTTFGFNGKVTYSLSSDVAVDLNADYATKEAGVPGPSVWPTPEARQKDENQLFGVTMRAKDTTARLYSHHSRIHYSDPTWMTDSTTKNQVYGGELQSSILVGSSNLITGGVEVIAESARSTIIGAQGRTRKGVFIQDEISAGETVDITLGVRYDDFEDGSRLTPRAGILFRPFEKMSLRAAAGKGYRIPTLNDLYWYEDFGWGMGLFGNPELKPEKSSEYELSLEYLFTDHARVKALVFRKDVSDLIIWQETSPFRWEAQNVDRVRIQGVEVTGKVTVGMIDFQASYFYQDPVNRNTDERVPDLPKHQASGIVTLFPFDGTTWSIEGRYVSNYIKPESPKWCYFVLDSKIAKTVTLSFGKGEVFLRGTNLLNRDYETTRGYPMPPIEFTGGVSITL